MKIFSINNKGLDKVITILNKEFVIKNYQLKRYIKKNKLQDYDTIYILLVNAGESFVISQNVKNLINNKTIFLLQHNYSKEIFTMYAPDAETKLINSHKLCNILRNNSEGNIKLENINIHILFPQNFWNNFWTKTPSNHFLKDFNEYFNIQSNTINKFTKPEINNNNEFLKYVNLKNLVILFTEVSSIKPINKKFWEALVKKLKQKGYNVFLNTCNLENYIQGCNVYQKGGKLKYLTLEECYIITKLAKGVIAHRCGFIEPLIAANNNWQVIYTKSHTFDEADVKVLYSLQEYPFVNVKDINEYQFEDYEDKNLLIDTIIANLEGDNTK